VPSADRTNDRTIAIRVNEVISKRMPGATDKTVSKRINLIDKAVPEASELPASK